MGAWLTRELQALLLQADVALVAQHVLATLRSASTLPAASPNRPGEGPARAGGGSPAKRPRAVPAAELSEDEVCGGLVLL